MACKIPSPSVTVQALLNAILCFLKQALVSQVPPSGSVFPTKNRNASVTTSWVSLPSDVGNYVSISNYTLADLDIKKTYETGPAHFITLAPGQTVVESVGGNASEIQIRAAAGATGVNYTID